MSWLDITAELTKVGQRKLEVGQVLIFDNNGDEIILKIMRKRYNKVWAKQVPLYYPEEVEVVDKLD